MKACPTKVSTMKLVIADCSAIYTGRGDTVLPRGVRTIMIKADGSVSIHNDKSNKPLNYMKTANFVEETNDAGESMWIYDSRNESLAITIHEIFMNTDMELMEDDPGLEKDGTEKHLQEWLSNHPEYLGEGFTIAAKEYQTGNGPVDLLALAEDGRPIAVEIKRIAMLGAVDQCRRYLDALRSSENDESLNLNFFHVGGMIAAVDIRPKTLEWAKKHKIATVIIPSNWRDIN